MKELKKNEKGFTLVELVVVIAILGVLVALIVPRIMGNVQDARRRTDQGNARTLASEITVWNAQQTSNATWITDTDGSGVIDQAEYTARRTLPTGITWPAATNATITVDSAGNASVNIIP